MLLAWAIIALLILLKHHTNIRRLLSGTERRVGDRREAAGDEAGA